MDFEWKDIEGQKLPTKRCVHQEDGCTVSASALLQKDGSVRVTVFSSGPAVARDFAENERWTEPTETVMRELIEQARKEHAERLAARQQESGPGPPVGDPLEDGADTLEDF